MVSIPIVGKSVDELKQDILDIVNKRIDLINKEEHKYLYGECYTMINNYNNTNKILITDDIVQVTLN